MKRLLLVLLCVSSVAHAKSRSYADLVAVFSEWRAFQKPRMVDGVPDYRAAAMEKQQRQLPDSLRKCQVTVARRSAGEALGMIRHGVQV